MIVYWLVWSGLPHAVDELSALSVSESLWVGNGVTVNQMEWDQWRTPPQNRPGVDGNLYSQRGLGVSLAALPLWIAGVSWLGGGAVRLALLTGPILAALAVGVMVWCVQRLGYGNRTAVLAGGVLGFATLLFPYARTLFSEAIAAPALALALCTLMVWRAQQAQSRWLLLLSGAALGVVILVKSSNGVIAPFFLLYVVWIVLTVGASAWSGRLLRLLLAGFWFSLPLAVAVGMTLYYNWMRFGALFSFPLESFEAFSAPLLTGIAGLLLSPGKGMFWYMPVALLSLAGAVWVLAKPKEDGIQRSDVLLSLATIVAAIAIYAGWYDWPDGRAWGPRMIAWLSPAFVLLALPLLAVAANRTRPLWQRGMVWAVVAISALVQIPGALVNFEQQEGLQLAQGVSFEALESLLLQGSVWQQAPFGLLLFAALLGVAIWLLDRHLRHHNVGAIWTALALVATAGVVLASATGDDPRWRDESANLEDNTALVAWLEEATDASDLLIFDLERERPVQSRAWWRQNTLPAGNPFVGWLRRTPDEVETDANAFALLDRQVAEHSRAWLVLQETPELDPASTTETHLNMLYFRGGDVWLGAQRVVPYYRWPLTPAPIASGEGIDFGTVQDTVQGVLEEWALYSGDGGSGDGEGRWLLLLDWAEDLDADLRFSVLALDDEGTVVAQIDRHPTDTNGRVGLDAPTATRLVLKVYDAVSGEALGTSGDEVLELWAEGL